MPIADIRLFGGLDDALRQVLDLRQQQMSLISGNLANADTPGYRARELDFANILEGVVRDAEAGDAVAMERVEVIEHLPVTWALDGNSVSAEHEAAKLVANRTVYEALAVGVGKHLALLRYAASDGRG